MPLLRFLQLFAILLGVLLLFAALLRPAVAMANRLNRSNDATDEIKSPSFAWSIAVMTVALCPALGWIGAGLPAVQPSYAGYDIVSACVALAVSILVTGGIMSLMLATTWRRGMGVAICIDAIVLALLGIASLAVRVIGS